MLAGDELFRRIVNCVGLLAFGTDVTIHVAVII